MKLINLTQGQQAVVDDNMFEFLNQFKWQAHFSTGTKTFYVSRSIRKENGKATTDYMHHYVIGKPFKGFQIDHLNGDTLDNRRENLHIVTRRQNQQNRKSHRAGNLVGCYYHKSSKKWRAQIRLDGKRDHIGLFDSEQEAYKSYLNALKLYNIS